MKNNISEEQIELSLSWLEGGVSQYVFTREIHGEKTSGAKGYITLARALKAAFEKGLILIKKT